MRWVPVSVDPHEVACDCGLAPRGVGQEVRAVLLECGPGRFAVRARGATAFGCVSIVWFERQ